MDISNFPDDLDNWSRSPNSTGKYISDEKTGVVYLSTDRRAAVIVTLVTTRSGSVLQMTLLESENRYGKKKQHDSTIAETVDAVGEKLAELDDKRKFASAE